LDLTFSFFLITILYLTYIYCVQYFLKTF
jgi:hypothetical protein